MLAVVHYAASCMLKKPFILWYDFTHSTRKEKSRRLASICVRQDFSLDIALSPQSEMPSTDGAGGKAKVGSQEQHCAFTHTCFHSEMT